MSEIDDLLRSLGFSTGPTQSLGGYSDKSDQPVRPFRGEPPVSPHELHGPDHHGAAALRPTKTVLPTAVPAHPVFDAQARGRAGRFLPMAPDTLEGAGLFPNEVSDLLLKTLSIRGIESGYNLARTLGLKFPLVEGILRQLKGERLVSYRNSAMGGDYFYDLTDQGRGRATTIAANSSYMGTAPVPLNQYIESVSAQSIAGRKPPLSSIRSAFGDLQVEDELVSNLGQAIHSGRGMFLYGPAGNGKTSLAERVTKSFGDTIWIPRTITASGEIIRLFDPNRHKPAPVVGADPELIDGRWIQIERPTIVAGGELRMDDLEITYIRRAGAGEAPLQMKANCGTLLIDDFGRQRMRIDELLNRWIVPLEQRYDYLHLESGRSIQVPFDELIVFSTNLQPKDLVDEAFLRRIPYKIEVPNPTEASFRRLFQLMSQQRGFHCDPAMLDYLIETHYRAAGRTFRFCHPRDLISQIENHCTLHEQERVVTREALDNAASNYFSIML